MLLSEKHCVPCREGTPSLDEATIRLLLGDVPGWSVEAAAGKPPRITRRYDFADFLAAMAFVDKMAALAEAEGHHPDFCVHDSRVDVSLSTHAARGLTENDFILAAKLDAAPPGKGQNERDGRHHRCYRPHRNGPGRFLRARRHPGRGAGPEHGPRGRLALRVRRFTHGTPPAACHPKGRWSGRTQSSTWSANPWPRGAGATRARSSCATAASWRPARWSTALRGLSARPRVLISASGAGYYGDRGDEILTQASPPGKGFVAELARDWEAEALKAEELGVRVVILRNGVVLAREGGILKKLLPPFRLGLGGKIGSGAQWMPWIHLEDEIGLIRHAITHESVRGPLNVVAPEPATNAEFVRAIGEALGRPTALTAPAFALRLAFGTMTDEVLLASQRVMPVRTLETGYTFRHPLLRSALTELLARRPRSETAEAASST